MNKYLNVVKKAEKDGNVTAKEQIKIDNMVKKVCKEDTKARDIIASKTGRVGIKIHLKLKPINRL